MQVLLIAALGVLVGAVSGFDLGYTLGNWLLTGEGEMLLPDDQGTIQVGGHHNTTQINSTGNIETAQSSDNEVITLQHTIELLQKDNDALHALLDEKERLIKVLLDKG